MCLPPLLCGKVPSPLCPMQTSLGALLLPRHASSPVSLYAASLQLPIADARPYPLTLVILMQVFFYDDEARHFAEPCSDYVRQKLVKTDENGNAGRSSWGQAGVRSRCMVAVGVPGVQGSAVRTICKHLAQTSWTKQVQKQRMTA